MPSYQRERDEFIALMAGEGVPVSVARKLLSAATTLQRLAELSCSSARADRDRVKCPWARVLNHSPRCEQRLYGNPCNCAFGETCLCKDYGSFDEIHGTVPRIAVQEYRTQRRVETVCSKYAMKPNFGGDPRGAVLIIKVPSGKSNDWGREGICVPANGYTAAQLERIG